MVLNLKIVTQGTDWGAYPLLYNPQAVFCESKEKKTLFLSKITTKQILYLAVLSFVPFSDHARHPKKEGL